MPQERRNQFAIEMDQALAAINRLQLDYDDQEQVAG